MRICRFATPAATAAVGFYFDDRLVPFDRALGKLADATEQNLWQESRRTGEPVSVLDFLPPQGRFAQLARTLHQRMAADATIVEKLALLTSSVQLLVPIPRPNKLLLLAGNYNEHIKEGGGTATERAETFPYVFMKPPSTTLVDPDAPLTIPAVSPHAIDWELELAVVIGEKCKGVRESDALKSVAGYTIVNDISDRKFRPNPGRKKRERDSFFDWLHGKWHDGFCPCGPAILSADDLPDPQSVTMRLQRNGRTMQDATTAQQIFSVAAVIEFISSFVTLEPGDIISTGTPAGVGNSTGTYLQPGDLLEATLAPIGTLRTPVVGGRA
ncbi:MAG: fumarylacetoacetate hydrolase family protein [Planctomycetes bacterium]|nr:fumarylacetoacetate hydrolase family protein [Planctomycetota bacterium]